MNYSVAIIGGGACGIITAWNLISLGKNFTLYLIEEKNQMGGVAYTTQNLLHPLNVRANNMGIKDPSDFYNWTKEKGYRYDPDDFLPRKIYGEYLNDLLDSTQKLAKEKNIQFEIIQDSALDIELQENGLLKIELKKIIFAHTVVLAVGSPPKLTPFEFNDPRYIGNGWQYCQISHKNSVLLVGSGLTMVDLLWTLHGEGFKGKIICVSPSGILPRVHFEKGKPLKLHLKPKRLKDAFKALRKKATKTNWQDLMDALRPKTVKLWKGFTLREKKRFLRHAFSIWNKLRHRMGPKSGELVANLFKQNSLKMIKGHISTIELDKNGLKVTLPNEVVEVDQLINCIGPEYHLAKNPPPLLENLHKRKLIEWDPLGYGLAIDSKGDLLGKGQGKIFALGSLLFGELLETTAIPEIRDQAHKLAKRILQKCKPVSLKKSKHL